MIDDIEDNSRLRRGAPVAHLVYGEWARVKMENGVLAASERPRGAGIEFAPVLVQVGRDRPAIAGWAGGARACAPPRRACAAGAYAPRR